jgi:uncharacterized protein DUF6916
MPLSRRTFLRDAFRTTLSVGVVVAAARMGLGQQDPTVPTDAQKDPVFMFAASTFELYVGDVFQAPNSRGELVELRLVSVDKYEAENTLTKRARPSESFSLSFKAAGELPPFTSIHTISHPRLGKFDLFLTRRKNDKGELYYEAVINHAQ